MKTLFKALALAAAAIPALVAAGPAHAQVAGVAIANLEQAIAETNAYRNAITQMRTSYKPQIDAVQARATALETELKPLVDKFQADQKVATPNRAALQTQYTAIQTKQQAGQAELQKLNEPVALAQAYVEEQIAAKLNDALKAAMTKKKVSLVLQPQAAVSFQPTVDITSDVTAELNTTVPAVQINPPAGWRPGAQQQAAAAGAPAAPAAPKPQGR